MMFVILRRLSLWLTNSFCSFLDIEDVKIAGKKVKWDLASRTEPYGSPLTIEVPEDSSDEADLEVRARTIVRNAVINVKYRSLFRLLTSALRCNGLLLPKRPTRSTLTCV